MLPILALIIVAAVIFGPHWWATHVITKYNRVNADFPGTGIDLARHLVDRLGIGGVRVEATQQPDHYDPLEKIVRLSHRNCDRKSLTAIVVATHEIGHALQDKEGYRPLHLRTKWVRAGRLFEKVGSALMMAIPLVAGLTRIPAVGLLVFLAGLATLGIPVVIHLITLPVEWDASFNRALPILRRNLPPEYLPAAEKILKACAITYVAASLAGLLNLWRWIRVLRR